MKIEYTLSSSGGLRHEQLKAEPVPQPQVRPHRFARIVALAHRLDELARSGAASNHRQLARLGHVSPERICQFMTLLHLAPAIQEYLLFMSTGETIPITEPDLRRIAREPRWDRQRAAFESLLRGK